MKEFVLYSLLDEMKKLSTFEIIKKIKKYEKINNAYKNACYIELKERKFTRKKYTHKQEKEFFNWLKENHPEYFV
jgi:hypothetical protein